MRPLRVVVIGSECTGKTTLARTLAERFGAPWVPEYCREWLESKGHALDASDVEPIARGQVVEAETAEARAGDLLVLDTDLVSTALYARHYYGSCPAWIGIAARKRRADLYLLCAPDLRWEADGQRDRGDRREEMHRLFEESLAEIGANVRDVRGTGPRREEAAVEAVADALARRSPGGTPAG